MSMTIPAEDLVQHYIHCEPSSVQEGMTAITSVEVFAIHQFAEWLLSHYQVRVRPPEETDHHIWCNFFMRPREGCKMCEGLYKNYPMDVPVEEMITKYFPGVVRR